MSHFSDSYSKFGSTDIHDTSEQSFQFFKNGEMILQPIVTPPEEEFDNIDPKQKEYERDLNIDIQRPSSTPHFQDTSNSTFHNPSSNLSNNSIPKQNIDFSNPRFGASSSNNTKSSKSQELDNRLELLLSQRKSSEMSHSNPNHDNINWTTGKIN